MRPGNYRALIASPTTMTDMARWIANELRRIELAMNIPTVAASVFDFDEGSPSAIYGIGTFDFDGGDPSEVYGVGTVDYDGGGP